MKCKAVLVVSFGTTYRQTREETIDAIEREIAEAYPGAVVRRAFTSSIVRRVLRERDGIEIDDVPQALERLAAEGISQVRVQPTHLMHGFEYDKLEAETAAFQEKFERVLLGRPLLSATSDYQAVVQILHAVFSEALSDPQAALVLMGHGTEHFANACYAALNYHFWAAGVENSFVGAIDGYPEIGDLLGQLSKTETRRVVLAPLMLVAGDHAIHDMAGSGPNSWKSRLEAAGYPVSCVVKGLGAYQPIRQLYLAHLADAR